MTWILLEEGHTAGTERIMGEKQDSHCIGMWLQSIS